MVTCYFIVERFALFIGYCLLATMANNFQVTCPWPNKTLDKWSEDSKEMCISARAAFDRFCEENNSERREESLIVCRSLQIRKEKEMNTTDHKEAPCLVCDVSNKGTSHHDMKCKGTYAEQKIIKCDTCILCEECDDVQGQKKCLEQNDGKYCWSLFKCPTVPTDSQTQVEIETAGTTPKPENTGEYATTNSNSKATQATFISTSKPGNTASGRDGREYSVSQATLAGGVVAGIIGGVVISLVVAVLCYCKRRSKDHKNEAIQRDSHIYLGVIPRGSLNATEQAHAPGENALATDVLDVSCSSLAQRHVTNKRGTDSESQHGGDYCYIKDEELHRSRIYSLGKAVPKDPSSNPTNRGAESLKTGEEHGMYNTLETRCEAPRPLMDTYNRTGGLERNDDTPAIYVVPGGKPGTPTTSKVDAQPAGCDQNTYNRLEVCPEDKDPAGSGPEGSSQGLTSPVYYVLEAAADPVAGDDTYNHLGETL